jgi:GNAT superfamily N-acetyltransferase
MKNILVREAVLADLDILLSFEQALIEAERPFDSTIRTGHLHYYDLKELILNEEAIVVVAEMDGRVLSSGFGLAKPARHYLDHTKYAYLGFMYTHSDYRGKGLNSKIIDALKEWAVQQGLYEIRLTVYQDNLPAIAAYEKAGFKKHIVEMRMKHTSPES